MRKPVTLSGKVNNKGTKDISAKSAATLELEADDFSFEPTFVKVKPGQKVAAGKSKKFTVTVPSNGTAFQFHCDFHEAMGMQGAFSTRPGATLASSSSTETPMAGGAMG